MIDTLPLTNFLTFPQKPGGVITCVFCGFSGVTKASFRYVNDVGNPTEGVCGRYECREKLAKGEVGTKFKIQFEPLPDLKIGWENRITFTPEKELCNGNGSGNKGR